MADQVASLNAEPAVFQLGLPPGNGSTSCMDCMVAEIIRHETGKTITAAQVRVASGHVGGAVGGLTAREALTALTAFGVKGYQYHSGVTAEDVLRATDNGVVLIGVGYGMWPGMKQAELGGRTDLRFTGAHAVSIWGRRNWTTQPDAGAWGASQVPFKPGWRFWARDPDHTQGWGHSYDRASTGYLVRAMAALVGLSGWTSTFMIAKNVPGGLSVEAHGPAGFDNPIGDPGPSSTKVNVKKPVTASIIGKLGRRDPKNAPALKLADILSGVVPAHPNAADNLSRVPAWILGENDKFGDCGPVSVANDRLQVTTYLGGAPKTVSQAAIFDLYRRSGNPAFDPATGADDNGVDMQTMLEALLADGIDGDKPLAFAKVDATNLEELRAAVAIFGGLLFGVTLDTVQQTQSKTGTWDYKSSPIWGGHAILGGSYVEGSVDRLGIVSWAEVIECTDPFLQNQLGEAWVVIWPEHLGSATFEQGIDQAKLAAAFEALTGRPFPPPGVPAPAPPPPVPPQPAPAPPPGAGGCGALLAVSVAIGALLVTLLH